MLDGDQDGFPVWRRLPRFRRVAVGAEHRRHLLVDRRLAQQGQRGGRVRPQLAGAQVGHESGWGLSPESGAVRQDGRRVGGRRGRSRRRQRPDR